MSLLTDLIALLPYGHLNEDGDVDLCYLHNATCTGIKYYKHSIHEKVENAENTIL